ncbi:A/G-specific adenine glycosylase [Legionella impletisoli]|uniref:Adenine DNA glycosylase n=1 Tax=Legionella impletisoli TaxID=343510 RepID=A0A917JRN6_9GAMM|nr:A/G-specific adenine glycosylase [Legionella impletisoli]GGI81238.1 A/G-specific adenine glycosylase [Legionella impletisoli]
MNTTEIAAQFTMPLLEWYELHGRKELPWKSSDPYPVWISEIMLQQTQVKTVIPFFNRFMARFPTIEVLAMASLDDVLAYWSGLGYYSRARNIHKTARILYFEHGGTFSKDPNELKKLPGIGDSTAAAITSLVFNKPTPILDGNVKRVLSRFFLVKGAPDKTSVKKQLWNLAAQCMSSDKCARYTQAIMDLGATCCTIKHSQCEQCPLHKGCKAFQTNAVSNYPYKKPKKLKPIKSQQFLLIFDEHQRIYLEKNPPEGLWGGLWCLPAIDKECLTEDYINEEYKLTVKKKIKLSSFKHAFSHFSLEIQPFALLIGHNDNQLTSIPKGSWWNLQEALDLGLPKPIRTIINEYQNNICLMS